MKQLSLFCFTFLCIISTSIGQEIQNTSNVWHFGNRAGLDFNTTPPQAATGSQANIPEGCAAVSDWFGELLFYTDGRTVWDKNHLAMPDGNASLNGDPDATESSLIVRNPGDANQYYIFTIDDRGDRFGLSYTIVDMTLAGNGTMQDPLGNVTSTRNRRILAPTSEKVAAVLKPDNTGFWIITHGWESERFYAFEVDCSGVNSVPITSDIGNEHVGGINNSNAEGQMKISFNGEKIALVNPTTNTIEVFDLDKATGLVSNFLTIATSDPTIYGLEFSLSGDFLYYAGSSSVSRFDLRNNRGSDVPIDRRGILSSNRIGALQLGPDANIYVAFNGYSHVGVIRDPENTNSSVTVDGVNLNSGISRLGLPNIFYYDRQPLDTITGTTCRNEPFILNGQEYAPDDYYLVNQNQANGCDSTFILFVDVAAGSTEFREFDVCEGGVFSLNGMDIPAGTQEIITYEDQSGCDSIIVIVVNEIPVFEEDLDINLCPGALDYSFRGQAYPIGTDTSFIVPGPLGCDSLFNLRITSGDTISFDLSVDSTCFGQSSGSVVVENIMGGTSPYEISVDDGTGLSELVADSLAAGDYFIVVSDANQCSTEETFSIFSAPEIRLAFQERTIPCSVDSIPFEINLLSGNEDQISWQWSDGLTQKDRFFSIPGLYQLSASNGCQTLVEDINIQSEVDNRQDLIYVPNAFTPNFDGVNDRFEVFLAEDVTIVDMEMHVYDRWGTEVFNTKDKDVFWEGLYGKGTELGIGVYVWWIKATLVVCKEEIEFFDEGDVTLLK